MIVHKGSSMFGELSSTYSFQNLQLFINALLMLLSFASNFPFQFPLTALQYKNTNIRFLFTNSWLCDNLANPKFPFPIQNFWERNTNDSDCWDMSKKKNFVVKSVALWLQHSNLTWITSQKQQRLGNLLNYVSVCIYLSYAASGTTSARGVASGVGNGDVRQSGHEGCSRSHGSTHLTWNTWPQSGSCRSSSLSL